MFAQNPFPFTSEDLAANRDGYMTKAQRAILNQDRGWWRFLIGLTLIGCPALSAYAVLDGIRINDTVPSRVGIVVLICILAGIGLIYTWDKWRVLNYDLKKGDVRSVDGMVNIQRRREKSGWSYSLRVQKITFRYVPPALVNAMQQSEACTIYYAPLSRRILSFEPLETDD